MKEILILASGPVLVKEAIVLRDCYFSIAGNKVNPFRDAWRRPRRIDRALEDHMSAASMNHAACEKCSFFDLHMAGQAAPKDGEKLGLCRYNPPVTQPSAEAHGLWPKVSNDDWCGHYEPETKH
ncbi:hypothetical protein [Roseomonas gilardii]|nr:hypothetical protein [Roseomonas gilardii]